MEILVCVCPSIGQYFRKTVGLPCWVSPIFVELKILSLTMVSLNDSLELRVVLHNASIILHNADLDYNGTLSFI